MANATASRDVKRAPGDLITALVKGATKLYAGTAINIDANGYAVKAADTAGHKQGGVAADTVDNTAGADGALKIAVYKEGTFEFAFSGTATQANVGAAVYAVDDSTVALAATTTNDILVGTIVEFIDASTVRVKI